MASIIVAYDKNTRGIGADNKLLWHIVEDMRFFRDTTIENPIVMGRKTWDSLPKKPLDWRQNIILSKTLEIDPTTVGACIARDVREAAEFISYFTVFHNKESFIIGGESIYKEFIGVVKKIYATEVDYRGGKQPDTFFPAINEDEWDSEIIYESDNDIIPYVRKVFTKKCQS